MHNESHLLPSTWSFVMLKDSTGRQNASRALGGWRTAEFLRSASYHVQPVPAHAYVLECHRREPTRDFSQQQNIFISSLHSSLAHRSTGMHKVRDSWETKTWPTGQQTGRARSLTSVSLTRSSSAPYKPNQKLKNRSQTSRRSESNGLQ